MNHPPKKKWLLLGSLTFLTLASALLTWVLRPRCDPRIARLVVPDYGTKNIMEWDDLMAKTIAEVGPEKAFASGLVLMRQDNRLYSSVLSIAIHQWKPVGRTTEDLERVLGPLEFIPAEELDLKKPITKAEKLAAKSSRVVRYRFLRPSRLDGTDNMDGGAVFAYFGLIGDKVVDYYVAH